MLKYLTNFKSVNHKTRLVLSFNKVYTSNINGFANILILILVDGNFVTETPQANKIIIVLEMFNS